MRSRAEDILQKAAAKHLDRNGWLWAHPANERDVSPRQGGQLKAKGVKKGIPDVLIFERWRDDKSAELMQGHGCIFNWYGNAGFGLAIELKVHGRKPEPEQNQWLADLKARGWYTAVARTLDEVKAICRMIPE